MEVKCPRGLPFRPHQEPDTSSCVHTPPPPAISAALRANYERNLLISLGHITVAVECERASIRNETKLRSAISHLTSIVLTELNTAKEVGEGLHSSVQLLETHQSGSQLRWPLSSLHEGRIWRGGHMGTALGLWVYQVPLIMAWHSLYSC